MTLRTLNYDRRTFMAALAASGVAAAAPFGTEARAAGLISGLGGLLASASDSALGKLAMPGAFFNDPAVRISLPLIGNLGGGLLGGGAPGGAGQLGGLLGGAGGVLGSNSGVLGQVIGQGAKLGLTDGLVRRLNDAAGLAAQTAKPVFRAAISRLSLTDTPGIATNNEGATQYLRTSAGSVLHTQMRPLIDSALGKVGAYAALARLGKSGAMASLAGIGREKLGSSVTDQAMNGIFRYIGSEESRLRANPVGAIGGILGGLLGN